MRNEPWNPDRKFPWDAIKSTWDECWDQSKPILLEKSPPNLSRAFEIESVFVPAYFIAMIQNPYAYCKGMMRRKSKLAGGVDGAARFWVQCAQYQRKNIQGLTRILHFTYESFTEAPSLIQEKIMMFMPELQRLNIDTSFHAESVLGAGSKKIVSLSQLKIDLLETKSILAINRVLEEYPDLMAFFGYDYIYPTMAHNLRHYGSLLSVNATKAARRLKRMRQNVLNTVRVGGKK